MGPTVADAGIPRSQIDLSGPYYSFHDSILFSYKKTNKTDGIQNRGGRGLVGDRHKVP